MALVNQHSASETAPGRETERAIPTTRRRASAPVDDASRLPVRANMMSYNTTRRKAISYEQTHQLIKLVKKSPGIWNHDDPNYNDRGATAMAWRAIAQQMELQEDLLKTKWKSLRDLFIRELKRLNLKGPNIDPEQARWRHFKKLWFLYRPEYWENKISLDENTMSEPVESNSRNDNYEIKIEPDPVNEFVFLDEHEDEEEKEESGKNSNPKVDPVDVKENVFLDQEPDYKRRRLDIYTEEDCDMMFFKSLMPYFKSLSPISKLTLRNRIQEMLLTEISKGMGSNGLKT